MLGGMGAMGGLCLVFGLAPQLLMVPVVAPAVRSLGFDWDVGISWLGVLTARGSIGVTVGAAAVVLSLALGLLIYHLAHAPAVATVTVFSGGEALEPGDRPGAVDFALAAEEAFHPVYSLDPDPLWLAIWSGLKRCADQAQAVACNTIERHPPATIAATAAAVALGVWLL